MDIDTIFGTKLHTSVLVNGLYVPAKILAQTLQLYTDPALFHTEEMGPYNLSKSGSLLRVKCNGRYFALMSAHQVIGAKSNYNYEQLCLHDNNGKLYTSHSAIYPVDDLDFEFDALLFEFTEVVEAGNLQSSIWLDVKLDELSQICPKTMRTLCIGYPGHRNNIDYEKNRYSVAPNAIWGEETTPCIGGNLAFNPSPPLSYEPSGMSGAPVFGIWIEEHVPKIYFAGIVSTASKHKFHFIPRREILSLFEGVFSKESDFNVRFLFGSCFCSSGSARPPGGRPPPLWQPLNPS